MYKYLNFSVEKEMKVGKNGKKIPNLKLVGVLENGVKEDLGAGWFMDGKPFGSFRLQEGITFEVNRNVYKPYEPNKKEVNTDEQQRKHEERLAKETESSMEIDALRGDPIDPSLIPF